MRKILTIFIVALPYILMNAEWWDSEKPGLYWGSCVYISLVSLCAGLLYVLLPSHVIAWFSPMSYIDEKKIKKYKTNGYSTLAFCFLFSLASIISYYRCPSVLGCP